MDKLRNRRHPMRLALLWALLTIFLISGLPSLGRAQTDLERYQQELEEVSQRIKLQQKQLQQINRQEKSVVGQLNYLEATIDQTESEIDYLQKRQRILNNQIGYTQDDLKRAQSNLDQRSKILNARLKEIYCCGDAQYLEVLLESTSMSDFLTRYDLLQKMVGQDLELLQEIEQQQAYIAARKADLENRQQEAIESQQQKEQKQGLLEQQSQEKERTLASLQDQKEEYKRALDELEATSKQLEGMIRQLQAKSEKPKQGSGGFAHPLPGNTRISSDYGMRLHPILKERRMHTGVDFPAPKGTAVRASQAGEVIFTGWMGGYGQVVIIDHGDGISTLYAHLSTIQTNNGANVNKGDRIAGVGSTGWSTGPHLHFEVRVKGQPVNPHKYI